MIALSTLFLLAKYSLKNNKNISAHKKEPS